jgi:hypothetical protein
MRQAARRVGFGTWAPAAQLNAKRWADGKRRTPNGAVSLLPSIQRFKNGVAGLRECWRAEVDIREPQIVAPASTNLTIVG